MYIKTLANIIRYYNYHLRGLITDRELIQLIGSAIDDLSKEDDIITKEGAKKS